MPTYLLTWNPKRWTWHDLDKSAKKIRADQHITERWSCGVNRSIAPGDRVFLIRLGMPPKGIIASGWVTSHVIEDSHWDTKLARDGKQALYVEIDLDVLLNPETDEILSREALTKGVLAEMHWDSQSSGIRIPDHVARELERKWAQFLDLRVDTSLAIPEEDLADPSSYLEGSTKQVILNTYERNPKAREKCLRHFGYNCAICNFNFKQTFGPLGDKFIHVHHLTPLSRKGGQYKLDPIRDLRPVCPNCHAMIHKRKPAFTITEVGKLRGNK